MYGDENVTVTGSKISVKANTKELTAQVWVVDMVMNSGKKKRIVIPNGKVSEIGDIVYTDGDPIGYELTVAAFPTQRVILIMSTLNRRKHERKNINRI